MSEDKPKLSPKGGWRPGAGRPMGSKNRNSAILEYQAKTQAMVKEIFNLKEHVSRMTPLDIMLCHMRVSQAEYESHLARNDANAARLSAESAVGYAGMAAPYIHAKLKNVTIEKDASASVVEVSDEELLLLIEAGKRAQSEQLIEDVSY